MNLQELNIEQLENRFEMSAVSENPSGTGPIILDGPIKL